MECPQPGDHRAFLFGEPYRDQHTPCFVTVVDRREIQQICVEKNFHHWVLTGFLYGRREGPLPHKEGDLIVVELDHVLSGKYCIWKICECE